MSGITSIIPMSFKETTGQVLGSIKFKLETKLIELSKLLDGTSKMEDFNKILESVKLNQLFSTLLELFQAIFHQVQEESEVLLLSDSKVQTKHSLLHLKNLSLIQPPRTEELKDTLNKEVTQKELSYL